MNETQLPQSGAIMQEPERQSTLLSLSKKQFAATIFGLQLILLLAALDQTIITTAMPRIVAELGGFKRYAWATTSYLLTSTVAVPVFGRLSDIYGRKPLLLMGVAVFVVASVLCGLAGLDHSGSGMLELVLARALQGIGGGIMLALTFSVIADILAPADRGRYQGHFAAVFALASIIGPALGGWVADQFTWRWLFFVNIPIGIAAFIVFDRSFPGTKTKTTKFGIDFAGIAWFCIMLTSLLIGLGLIPECGLTSFPVLACLALAALTAVLFVPTECRAEHPLMPLKLFTHPVIAISSLSLFVTGTGMFGSVLLIPLFLQAVKGVSAAVSGALLSPLILTAAVASVIGGLILSKKRRYKSLILFALLLMVVGMFQLSHIGEDSPLTLIIAYMLVVGAGMGLLLPIYTIVIQNAVPQDEVGTVTGFSQFFRSIGGTVGVGLFGSLMLNSYHHNLRGLIRSDLVQAVDNPLEPIKLRAHLAALVHDQSTITDILTRVRHALVLSVDHVFMLYTGALAITLIITLWLEDRQLRSASESVVQSETV
jgi:EmrB/QacA subfamily drug resistance transporter